MRAGYHSWNSVVVGLLLLLFFYENIFTFEDNGVCIDGWIQEVGLTVDYCKEMQNTIDRYEHKMVTKRQYIQLVETIETLRWRIELFKLYRLDLPKDVLPEYIEKFNQYVNEFSYLLERLCDITAKNKGMLAYIKRNPLKVIWAMGGAIASIALLYVVVHFPEKMGNMWKTSWRHIYALLGLGIATYESKLPDEYRNIFGELIQCVKKNNVRGIKKFFKQHSSIAQVLLNACDEKFGSLLHIAVMNGNENIVKLLVNAGATVHIQNAQGITPIWYAVQQSKPELVELLARNLGSDINAVVNSDGQTALEAALNAFGYSRFFADQDFQSQAEECVQKLLAHGAMCR